MVKIRARFTVRVIIRDRPRVKSYIKVSAMFILLIQYRGMSRPYFKKDMIKLKN